jgi:hypothetical protein
MARVLNITNDVDLETARASLAQAITGVDVKDLRDDMGARKEVKASVDAIRSAFSF